MVYTSFSCFAKMPKAPLIQRVHPKRKPCKSCKQIKPINVFELKPTEASYRNICRTCRNYAQRTRRRLRKQHMKEYGKPQNQPCKVCSQKVPLVFDHCHRTSRFRGWICKDCNAAIGKLGDNLEGLERARTYLREFEAAEGLLLLSN